jgi:DNA-binding transcriptional ArsR family regulator
VVTYHVSDVFRALADSKRRILLSAVQEHRSVTLPDLAELVAERERGTNVTEISDEEIRDVYMALYHTHIPPLREANLVQYDQDDDLVLTTDQTRSSLIRARNEVASIVESA